MPSRRQPGEKQIVAKSQKGQQVPNFTEDQAREYFEKIRWGVNGVICPVCPHCGSEGVYRLGGDSTRDGLLKCRDCKGQFSVTLGTIMEDTHLPLATWAKAFHYMASSKKGMSALQLQRNLGLGSYRTAWHLAHRIRYAMQHEGALLKGQVQVDEAYIGGKPRPGTGPHKRGRGTKKAPVVVLVETDGSVHSRYVERINSDTLRTALEEKVDKSAQIVTDDLPSYISATVGFTGGHESVNHSSGEYVRLDGINTNTAESFFALMKRGVYGVFHHVSKKHLHRYCAEFDFRWNGREVTDTEHRDQAVRQIEGKRLFYRQPIGEA